MKSGRTLVPHKVVCYHVHRLPSTHRIAAVVPRGFLQVKFSDDTSLPGMITKEENTYRTGVQKLVECCDENLFASEYQQDQAISNRLPEQYLFTRPLQIKGQKR